MKVYRVAIPKDAARALVEDKQKEFSYIINEGQEVVQIILSIREHGTKDPAQRNLPLVNKYRGRT